MTDQTCYNSIDAAQYIDDLWFLLHHSEDEDRVVVGLTCYLDDSGSDPGSPLVTCGGVVMSGLNFKAFCARWLKMYERHQKLPGPVFEPPLHMSDFLGRAKYAGLYPEFKRSIFGDAARLINEHKLYSISIAVPQTVFASELSEEVRKVLIGPYAFAFFTLVLAHQTTSETLRTGPLKASYLVDHGVAHQDQLNAAYQLIVDFEIAMGGFRHTGALAIDTDDRVPALQAADVIAWTSRRMQLDGSLPEGFEPLSEVLREDLERPHVTIPIDRDAIKRLTVPINNWIAKNGSVPKLTDIVVRRMNGIPVKLKA